MKPVRRDIGQGAQHEAALVGARVGEYWVGRITNDLVHGDDVQIERARGVGYAPRPSSLGLDSLESEEQGVWGDGAGEVDDSVDVVGLSAGRDGGGAIPARKRAQTKARDTIEACDGPAARVQGRSTLVWQVGADGYQQHAISNIRHQRAFSSQRKGDIIVSPYVWTAC